METQASPKGRSHDKRRRAFDTELHNADGKGSRRLPIYQRRTLPAVSMPVRKSETELDMAARALSVLWRTTSK